MEDVLVHSDGEGEEIGYLSPSRSDWEIVASDPASPLADSNYDGVRGEQEENEAVGEEHGECFRLVGDEKEQGAEEAGWKDGSKKHRQPAINEYFTYGVLPLSASGTVLKEEIEPEGTSLNSGSQEMAGCASSSSQTGMLPHEEAGTTQLKNSSGASASGTIRGSFSDSYELPNVPELVDEARDSFTDENERGAQSVVSEPENRDGGGYCDLRGGNVRTEIEAGEDSSSLHQSAIDRERSSNTSHLGEPVVMHDHEPSALASGSNSRAEELLSSHGGRASHRKGYASVTMAWLRTHLGQWWAYIHRTKRLCSAALLAAVVGFLILGRGWQRIYFQNRQLQSQILAKDKKISQLMFQLIHMKEVIANARRIPVVWTKTSLQIP